MSWSLKIGTLFGIPIRLHITMLIVPFFAFSSVSGGGPLTFAFALGLTVLLFASVVAHELGHSLTARRFGVRTADIILTPIGGIARIVNLPTKPAHEIAIAIAGPLVSLAIAAGAFSLIIPTLFAPAMVRESVRWLFYMNLMLGLFNLVPALPMDGGRVLRGLLALKRDYLSATRIAARIGRAIAIAGFVYAIWTGSWNLGFIALFVFMGAGTEERVAWMREAAKRNAEAPGSGGPFGGVYTWRWTSRGRGPVSPAPPTGWDEPTHSARPGDVLVIQGGKAEVVSRRDPEERK